jgi:long-chain fatty acid transport protein
MDIFRIGVEHQTTEQLKLRAGVSYATDFADDAQVLFNILAPATPKVHAALGMTYSINPAWAITGSYAHAFSNSLTGRNPSMTPTQDTKLRMDQDEFAVGFSYRF